MSSPIWKWLVNELKIWRVGALPGVVVIAVVGVARFSGALQPLEWSVFDRFLRWRPAESQDQRVVIVGIDEADIQQMGTYPVPDREIAALITQLKTYQPAAIGLDIFRDLQVPPGHAALQQVFQTTPNLFAVEKVLPDQNGLTVPAPPALPSGQAGFADAVFDRDGYLRRSLLGTFSPSGTYHLSLSIQLAARFLETKGISLENGVRDPEAMQFGSVELTRIQPNTGGYVGADAGGNQILIHFRSGSQPFRILTMREVMAGTVDPSWLRGQVVIIGIMAASAKDFVNSAAIATDNPALVYGVEVQAHAVSQLISAVLDRRPLLRAWAEPWEYGWILLWGVLGISLGRIFRSPMKLLLGLGVLSIGLVGVGYGLLLLGWWVPVVPALLVLVLNGAGLTASLFYRYERDLRARLQERQMVIDHAFNAIHNGPLQTLANLLRRAQSESSASLSLLPELQTLNQELRSVYDAIRKETLTEAKQLYLDQALTLNLDEPLHEALYEVYCHVLERDFPCFKAIKVKVVSFEPLDEQDLTMDQRRGLCRFLEETLCNVGKYATHVTRLEITCARVNHRNVIRVVDNGAGQQWSTATQVVGLGTQHAQRLAQQLNGQFQRQARSPQGTCCELVWPIQRRWFWQF